MYLNQTIMLYTLNLNNDVCQSFLKEKNWKKQKRMPTAVQFIIARLRQYPACPPADEPWYIHPVKSYVSNEKKPLQIYTIWMILEIQSWAKELVSKEYFVWDSLVNFRADEAGMRFGEERSDRQEHRCWSGPTCPSEWRSHQCVHSGTIYHSYT